MFCKNNINPDATKYGEWKMKNPFRHKHDVQIMAQDVFAFLYIQGP
jgi:hypothetical protein